MSKILEATCAAGEVICETVTVPDAEILSEGVGQSVGLLLIEKDKSFYVTSNATDIKTTLEKLTTALTKVTETLTDIGAGMTGPTTAPPPSLATNVSTINSLVAELSTLKENLK